MKTKHLIFTIGLILTVHLLWAQAEVSETEISVSTSNFISNNNGQPFWLHANRLGIVDENESIQGMLNFSAKRKHVLDYSTKKYWEGGMSLLGRYYGNESIRFVEYWGRFNYKGFYVHAGAKGESDFNNGISLTNGNLYLSNNARPMPRVEIGATAFHPFTNGVWKKISFEGLYSEYFLLDDRYIKNAHLHHKRLGVNYKLSPSWGFSFAIDHWAFWGGEFPDGSKIPGIEDYLRHIFAFSGSEESIITEQQNASGNHTGQYQFLINHKNKKGALDFYWQHLWEDGTGLKFKNISDGLWGISYTNLNKQAFLNGLVFEYVHTKHQSGRYHDYNDEFIGGRDNYFNHGIYRSGFTSYGRMIGMPLLIPEVDSNGISKGFESNRLWSLHSGLSGSFSKELFWRFLLTYSEHFGTHATPFSEDKDLFSLGFDINWSRIKSPFSYRLKIAVDRGDYLPKTEGIEFSASYHFNKSR